MEVGEVSMADKMTGELMSFSPFSVVTAGPVDLVGAFLAGRNPKTLLAYRRDLEDFTAFVGAASLNEAAALLLSQGSGSANGMALAYRVHLQERGLASATVNRRLASLRSLVKLARLLGMIPWTLEVESMKTTAYRDTRGCGTEGFRLMLDSLEAGLDAKTIRDRCILRLLYAMALRRGEVCSLDLCHLDLQGSRLSILGKGRTQRESITIPPKVLESLKAWVETRGSEPGALFTALDRGHRGPRSASPPPWHGGGWEPLLLRYPWPGLGSPGASIHSRHSGGLSSPPGFP